jgi:murein L,D-transpeptidase YcbB/YkuD
MILEDDKEWTPEKVDSIMHGGKETWYTLKEKIPVYIGYFTAWVDDQDQIHFYDDVYKRDKHLAELIFNEK